MGSTPQVVMHDGIAVIDCPERIVAGEIEQLRTAALNAIERTGHVILQLQSVRKIDSSGLGLLARLCVSARRRKGDVTLVAPPLGLAEFLEKAMLRHLFTAYPSVQAAVAALHGEQSY